MCIRDRNRTDWFDNGNFSAASLLLFPVMYTYVAISFIRFVASSLSQTLLCLFVEIGILTLADKVLIAHRIGSVGATAHRAITPRISLHACLFVFDCLL